MYMSRLAGPGRSVSPHDAKESSGSSSGTAAASASFTNGHGANSSVCADSGEQKERGRNNMKRAEEEARSCVCIR